jgi:uncharacterized protein (TIGR02996 family)
VAAVGGLRWRRPTSCSNRSPVTPGDDTLRLAYADAVEHRAPEPAAFIRLQIERFRANGARRPRPPPVAASRSHSGPGTGVVGDFVAFPAGPSSFPPGGNPLEP